MSDSLLTVSQSVSTGHKIWCEGYVNDGCLQEGRWGGMHVRQAEWRARQCMHCITRVYVAVRGSCQEAIERGPARENERGPAREANRG